VYFSSMHIKNYAVVAHSAWLATPVSRPAAHLLREDEEGGHHAPDHVAMRKELEAHPSMNANVMMSPVLEWRTSLRPPPHALHLHTRGVSSRAGAMVGR
jgi:hypothetical protein